MAYQLSSIVTKVQKRIRDTGYSSSTIKEFINDAQNALFNEYDLRFMETSQGYTLTVDIQDITNGSGLPSNFVRAIDLFITTDDYAKILTYVDFKDIDKAYPDAADDNPGTPRFWYMVGNTINVYPKPDQAYTLTLRFIKRPTELSADADVPEVPKEFEELLVYGASYRAFEEKDMDDKAAVFENKYLAEVQKLVNRYSRRQTSSPMTMKLARRNNASRFFS